MVDRALIFDAATQQLIPGWDRYASYVQARPPSRRWNARLVVETDGHACTITVQDSSMSLVLDRLAHRIVHHCTETH